MSKICPLEEFEIHPCKGVCVTAKNREQGCGRERIWPTRVGDGPNQWLGALLGGASSFGPLDGPLAMLPHILALDLTFGPYSFSL